MDGADETLSPGAPANGEAPTQFDPEASQPQPERRVLRTVTLVQYDGAYGIEAHDGDGKSIINIDLPGVKGCLDYGLHWIALQWELGDMARKFEVQVELVTAQQQAAQAQIQVAQGLGTAARFFGGGKRH